MSKLDGLSTEILKAFLTNFVDQKLGVDALADGYVGSHIAELKQKTLRK